MSETPPDERVGRTVASRYRLDRVLTTSERGRRAVYAGVDQTSGRAVLVTVTRDGEDRPTLADLDHSAVVALRERVAEPDGDICRVLELPEGDTLRELLARGRMTLWELTALLDPILEAMATAHDRGTVHGALEPSLVYLVPTAAGPSPRLLDLGLAGSADRPSPSYSAPEQRRGLAPGPAADVWSMGALIFEALSGGLPLDPMSPAASATIPSLGAAASDVDPAIVVVVDRALRLAPSERYPTMGALRAALLAALDNELTESASLALLENTQERPVPLEDDVSQTAELAAFVGPPASLTSKTVELDVAYRGGPDAPDDTRPFGVTPPTEERSLDAPPSLEVPVSWDQDLTTVDRTRASWWLALAATLAAAALVAGAVAAYHLAT